MKILITMLLLLTITIAGGCGSKEYPHTYKVIKDLPGWKTEKEEVPLGGHAFATKSTYMRGKTSYTICEKGSSVGRGGISVKIPCKDFDLLKQIVTGKTSQ